MLRQVGSPLRLLDQLAGMGLPVPCEIAARSLVMSPAFAAHEALDPVSNLPGPGFACFDDARLSDDDVAKLKQRITAEEAREHRDVAGVHALLLRAGRAGLDVGGDQELFREGMSAERAGTAPQLQLLVPQKTLFCPDCP